MAKKNDSVSLQKELINSGPTQEGSKGSPEVIRKLKKLIKKLLKKWLHFITTAINKPKTDSGRKQGKSRGDPEGEKMTSKWL